MKIRTLTIALALMLTLTSCSDSAVAIPDDEPYSGVPLVIYDADIGSSTDDLFALQMLHRYQDAGKCKLLGVVVDRMGDNNAAIADLLNTYYGHPTPHCGLRAAISEIAGQARDEERGGAKTKRLLP